ncbi:LOW QUALITY PROTEIN: structure-specific endonuclease subunit SLX4 [Manduca sexta]|uniref:LOW QUALITY PROTEIN: structure-specific endonuclease subunit SLX4 n=1 Tax=Manduca sexta TaxID=7130 RepID=UPI0018902839|nr:LOW QUALITY PROTEIN: structure-specific endonuclease subunit SLX4 [Manduca sexta]
MNVGCNRDWAKIPGRPASPEVSSSTKMNFSEIECSQEELDVVLSGLLTQSKKIISLKQTEKEHLQIHASKNLKSKVNNQLSSNNDIPSVITEREESNEEIATENKNTNHEVIYRSCSPDIFDDEESVLEVIPTNTTVHEKASYIMDLTECVNNVPLKNKTFTNSNVTLSQKSNPELTRRISDDFMEITECVAHTSNAIHVSVNPKEVPEGEEVVTIEKNEGTLDLTQSSESGDDLPEVYFGSNKNFDDTMPLNVSDYAGIINKDFNPSKKDNCDVLYDLTQDDVIEIKEGRDASHTNKGSKSVENNSDNICSNDKPTQHTKGNENNKHFIKSPNSSNPSSITQSNTNSKINDEDLITENNRILKSLPTDNTKNQISENNVCTEINNDLPDDNVDLTQSSDETVAIEKNTNSQVKNNDTARNSNLDVFNITPNKCDDNGIQDYEIGAGEVSNNDMLEPNIDLTQSSNTSTPKMDGVYEKYSSFEHSLENSNDSDKTIILPLQDDSDKVIQIQDDHNSLGNKDNISVVYDEVSFLYNANEVYKGNNSRTSLTKGYEDENKRDHSDLGEGLVRRIDSNSNGSDKTVILPLEDKTEKTSSLYNLGKKDNVSIDYDEVSIIHDYYDVRDMSRSSNSSKAKDNKGDFSQSTQNSEFRLTDNELNYSLHKSKRENFDFGGLSILDNLPNVPSFRKSREQGGGNLNKDDLLLELKSNEHDIREGTPDKNIDNLKENAKTPENEYIIKFDNVTPMPDYTRMSSPEIIDELDKYGLKPFKRKRAIQLLTHIYNQTHPIIESMDDLPSPAKRMKLDVTPPSIRKKLLPSPKKALEMLEIQDIYEVTNEVPELKETECAVEDWVFQKREKAKVHSCRVPLHIAFHNYVSCRRGLRESILRYEPVDIDVIHKQLVAYGHRYDPKELLKFMDKKCITVKTADNKNNKY